MTDFKAGDKVVVNHPNPWWTKEKVYQIGSDLMIKDDEGDQRHISCLKGRLAPAPDADGWYPMPKLKAGDPIPEWLVDSKTRYRLGDGTVWDVNEVALDEIIDGTYRHYHPAPKAEIATTPDGKEYRITHDPDGSVSAEVV